MADLTEYSVWSAHHSENDACKRRVTSEARGIGGVTIEGAQTFTDAHCTRGVCRQSAGLETGEIMKYMILGLMIAMAACMTNDEQMREQMQALSTPCSSWRHDDHEHACCLTEYPDRSVGETCDDRFWLEDGGR